MFSVLSVQMFLELQLFETLEVTNMNVQSINISILRL